MITLSVAGRGSKHTLECDPSESIGAVKARLAPLVSMAPADLKLIVKGKLWDDDAKTLGSMADAGATVCRSRGRWLPAIPGATLPRPSGCWICVATIFSS